MNCFPRAFINGSASYSPAPHGIAFTIRRSQNLFCQVLSDAARTVVFGEILPLGWFYRITLFRSGLASSTSCRLPLSFSAPSISSSACHVTGPLHITRRVDFRNLNPTNPSTPLSMKLRNSTLLSYPGLLLLLSRTVVGYDNGLALTPQMGWNTWNAFGCDIDEELIVESAKVVADRMKVFGYECGCYSP